MYTRWFKSINNSIILQHVNEILKHSTDICIYRSRSTGLQIWGSASTGTSMSTAAIFLSKEEHVYASFPVEEIAFFCLFVFSVKSWALCIFL